jgi:hypothetical protein
MLRKVLNRIYSLPDYGSSTLIELGPEDGHLSVKNTPLNKLIRDSSLSSEAKFLMEETLESINEIPTGGFVNAIESNNGVLRIDNIVMEYENKYYEYSIDYVKEMQGSTNDPVYEARNTIDSIRFSEDSLKIPVEEKKKWYSGARAFFFTEQISSSSDTIQYFFVSTSKEILRIDKNIKTNIGIRKTDLLHTDYKDNNDIWTTNPKLLPFLVPFGKESD